MNLDYQINLAQISFFLGVIALVLVYIAFYRKPRNNPKHK